MSYSIVPSGPAAIHHPGEHSWECTAVSIAREPDGFWRVTTAGSAGVQSVVVGDAAAAAVVAVTSLDGGVRR